MWRLASYNYNKVIVETVQCYLVWGGGGGAFGVCDCACAVWCRMLFGVGGGGGAFGVCDCACAVWCVGGGGVELLGCVTVRVLSGAGCMRLNYVGACLNKDFIFEFINGWLLY